MCKITVENISFSYPGGEQVLKDIHLEFDSRPTAIIGQNGAGKTTFVKLLKGLLTPTAGNIFINKKNTKDVSVAQLAKEIGLIFQNPNDQIFKNNLLDEVMFGPINLGISKAEALEKAKGALERVGLGHLLTTNPYDLGLSERKLVSIASILAMDTDIVIFDEPTIAQDYDGKRKIQQIIRDLSKQGKLVLTIIHDMDFVAENFERTIVFQNGKVLVDADTRTVFSQEILLKQAKLDLPHVTQLCKKLGYKQTFLTVEEFVQYNK